MTLVATWYPTEEQRLEFAQMWARVYPFEGSHGPVLKVSVYKYDYPEGGYYARMYWVDSQYTTCRELILTELIKAGYFVL